MTIQEKIKQFTLEFDPILENEISQLVDQQLEFHPAQTVLDAQLKFNIQEYAKNGKRVRPFLISFFAGKNLADRDLLHMAVASELFHLAALLQDDVMDGSKMRRGVPTMNAIGDNLSRNNSHLGDHVGVLLGDVFLTRSIEFASRLPEPIFKEFITMIQRTTRGQYLDAFGMNEDYGTSSLEDVLARHDLKTAWYTFASPARIGYMLSDNPDQGTLEVLSTTVRELGLLFQIRDDIIDCIDKNSGKPMFADILENQTTWVTLYVKEYYPEKFLEIVGAKELHDIQRLKSIFKDINLRIPYEKEFQKRLTLIEAIDVEYESIKEQAREVLNLLRLE